MLARRARGLDLSDGHSALAALVSALARPRTGAANVASTSGHSSAGQSRLHSTTAGSATSPRVATARSAHQQQLGKGSRRRFCELQAAREQRPADRRDAGFEGPVASTSAVTLDSPAPQRAPPAPPVPAVRSTRPKPRLAPTAAPHILLKSIRTVHVSSPTTSPIDIVASQRPILYDDDGDSQHPPTPPPPIAFLPEPNRPNPHMLSAFLLQAIFLGASALGLLTRRKVRNEGRPMQVELEEATVDSLTLQSTWAKQELDEKRRQGEFAPDDVPSLNLLLSAYAELDPAMETAWKQEMPRQERHALSVSWTKRRSAHLGHVSSLLARFNETIRPDYWTILAVLNFACPSVNLPRVNLQGSLSPFEQGRPLLVQWAWKAFAELQQTSSISSDNISAVVIDTFVDYLRSPASEHLDPSAREGMLTAVFNRALSTTFTFLAPTRLLNVGLLALSARHTSVLVTLLSAESSLPARERSQLALATLEATSLDEEWRKNRDVVSFVARAIVIATEELCTEGIESVEADVVEKAARLLIGGFGVNVHLEPLIAALVSAPLRQSPAFFSHSFIHDVLYALVESRNPSLAAKIFALLPLHARKPAHYHALLRSHHRPTSNLVWQELQERWASGKMTAQVEAWECRLKGLLSSCLGAADAREALCTARTDLTLLRAFDKRRSPKLSNTLLRLVSKASYEPAWRRQVGKTWREGQAISPVVDVAEEKSHTRGSVQKPSRVSKTVVGSQVDEYTRSIMLGRLLEGQLDGERSSKRGKEQLAALREEMARMDGMMQRRQGLSAAAESSDKVDISRNIYLKGATRWTREVGTSTLVSLAERTLGIDLQSSPPSADLDPPKVAPTHVHYRQLRRPAYRLLLKALRNRGERQYHDRLVRMMREEEARIRRAARETSVEAEEVVEG